MRLQSVCLCVCELCVCLLTHLSELHGDIQVSMLGAVVRRLLQGFHPGLTQPGGDARGVRRACVTFRLLLHLHSFGQDLLQRQYVLLPVLRLQQQPPQDVPAHERQQQTGETMMTILKESERSGLSLTCVRAPRRS